LLKFDYRQKDRRAILTWDHEDETYKWFNILCDLCIEASENSQREGAAIISVPWWSFLSIRPDIYSVVSAFGLRKDNDFSVSSTAIGMIEQARLRHGTFFDQPIEILSDSELRLELSKKEFARSLTREQARNVALLVSRHSGATFSVPGAGKTTEALATFALRAAANDKLLVVAPKNAFAAWDEQILECLPKLNEGFVRLRKTDKIPHQLLAKPKLSIIGYQQLVRVKEHISEFLFTNNVHVFIDESHRIKGLYNLSTQAILSFSHLPVGKLIMSGTPMPQSADDLVPQFNFLFPEVKANADNVVDLVRKVYVRTNKSELNLPDVTRHLIRVEMEPEQAKLYRLLKSEMAREAEKALKENTKFALRRFGRSVTSVLQFVSNPALLAEKPDFKFAEELAETLSHGDGPKIRYVIKRTRELTNQGHKVLIWSSFVKNVEYLSLCLQDLGAVFIHGGVDAGSEEDEDTREGKIKRFHDDANTQVMIANPAAASEGISLHKVCHHAIYLDRNFNAAQYLQSEDRIHRLGLAPGQETHIELVECAGTIDETVRIRLELKIDTMAAALDDSELNITPLMVVDEEEPDVGAIDIKDIEALAAHLRED
jgi:SNF2 family DNA or RNA helicase